MAFDKDLVWQLPEGDPPYKSIPGEELHLMLWHEMRRMYIFLAGDHPVQRLGSTPEEIKKLGTIRERNFIQLLETLEPADAKLVLAVKDKRVQREYPGIDGELIRDAWPDLCQGMNLVVADKLPDAAPKPSVPRRKDGKFAKKVT